ncbi:hypothetical protein, partial [Pectobacterium versatile]|uniref:hypothetical protein n=1 Tax=Pectobacterium versatile TaxID=2488639 RepID=UPI0020C0B55B
LPDAPYFDVSKTLTLALIDKRRVILLDQRPEVLSKSDSFLRCTISVLATALYHIFSATAAQAPILLISERYFSHHPHVLILTFPLPIY